MIFKINVIFHCMGALLDTVQRTVLSRLRRNESITGCYIVKLLETVGAARSELPGRLPLAGITQRTRRTRSRITTRKGAGAWQWRIRLCSQSQNRGCCGPASGICVPDWWTPNWPQTLTTRASGKCSFYFPNSKTRKEYFK